MHIRRISFGTFLCLSIVFHVLVFFLIIFARTGNVQSPPESYIVRIVDLPAEPATPPAFAPEMPEDPLRSGNHVAVKEMQRKALPEINMAKPDEEKKLAKISEENEIQTNMKEGVVKEENKKQDLLPLPSQNDSEDGVARISKDKLFDRNVIKEFAKSTPQNEDRNPDITFDTKEYRYRNYMEKLKESIESVWIYPRDAADKGIYGDLIIRFVILKDGKLGSVKVIRTSGHQLLDEAAIKAIKEAEPFWPLPDDWKADSFSVSGHFIYTLYGMYVR